MKKRSRSMERDKIAVALAGNPNVGKSTLFNSLTGMHRHTGNWAGKTVSVATSDVKGKKRIYSFADIPGTYSLLSHSKEEEIARNYICFGGADVTVVVCDATSLEHSLGLVIQIAEITKNLIVCINLMDEAERCGIKIDTDAIESLLGVPVIGVVARRRKSLDALISTLDRFESKSSTGYIVGYSNEIEQAIKTVSDSLLKIDTGHISHRWLALRLIEADEDMNNEIFENLGLNVSSPEISSAVCAARELLFSHGVDSERFRDEIVGSIVSEAERISRAAVKQCYDDVRRRERSIDKILTGKYTAFPVMIALLGVVLWITMFLASYPSAWLSSLFYYIEDKLLYFLAYCGAPEFLSGALIYGIYRTTTTVVAVMLPPMAIFFPMFTLLEDSGYLPRVAYNLDRPFAVCGACGKQSLTMCMGLGCNAVGICGARIIDSKRERLIAILTNSLIPCNGRLPMLLSIICASFIAFSGGAPSVLVVLCLLALILLSVAVSFLCTLLLSKTLLSGERSSFTIELPPYRRPEFLKVIFRSLTTKVVSVLLRAIAVAAPMGLVIYLLSSIRIDGASLVSYASQALAPIGKVMGLDGSIILAFILGIPANEIVIPILIMLYTSGGVFGESMSNAALAGLFLENGWSVVTSVCMAIFALFHWPCSTSVITVYKETKSKKYTLIAAILPAAVGFTICTIINLFAYIFTSL